MQVKTIFLFSLLAAVACDRRTPTGQTGQATATDSVRETLNRYFADIRQEGLTAEFRYLDSSKDFNWTPPGYATPISYDSVAAILTSRAPVYRDVDNTWDSLEIRLLNSDTAEYSGRVRSTLTDTSGKTTRYLLTETGRLVKRKEGWKLLSGHTQVTGN